jgi:prophage regulatory protein
MKAFLRLPQVETLCGRKRSSIYQDIAAGKFPKPIKLNPPNGRAVGWPEDVIREYQDRVVATQVSGPRRRKQGS